MDKREVATFALLRPATDGSELFFHDEKYPNSIKNDYDRITLFPTKQEAELVRAVQYFEHLDDWEVVVLVLSGAKFRLMRYPDLQPIAPK